MSEASSRGGLFATLKEALRGSSQDYTRGPVGRALLLLAIPMVMETALESVFALSENGGATKLRAYGVPNVDIVGLGVELGDGSFRKRSNGSAISSSEVLTSTRLS